MTDAPELKPCPFCGSNEIDPRSGGSPECSICGASACNSDWNTRVDLSDARIAELEAERDERARTASKLDSAAMKYRARAEAAEAKLAVAEEFYSDLLDWLDENDCDTKNARATLAQLKGTADE